MLGGCWVKQCQLHHPPVITIFIGVVYGIVVPMLNWQVPIPLPRCLARHALHWPRRSYAPQLQECHSHANRPCRYLRLLGRSEKKDVFKTLKKSSQMVINTKLYIGVSHL